MRPVTGDSGVGVFVLERLRKIEVIEHRPPLAGIGIINIKRDRARILAANGIAIAVGHRPPENAAAAAQLLAESDIACAAIVYDAHAVEIHADLTRAVPAFRVRSRWQANGGCQR